MCVIGENRRRDRNKFRLDSCFLDEQINKNYEEFEKKKQIGTTKNTFEEVSDNEEFIVDCKHDHQLSKESKPNIKNQSRSFNKIGSFEIQNRVEMSEEDKMSEINEANEKENTGSSFSSISR